MQFRIMQHQRAPLSLVFTLGLALLTVAIITSVVVGPIAISLTDSIKALLPWQFELPIHIELVINQIRLPRTLLCIAVGAILALCGTVMQGLFRNPLADPGIIGVSGGASLGAAIAIVLFAPLASSYPLLLTLGTVPIFAFVGGAASTYLVYRLGTDKTGTSVTFMLLAGVAIGALSGAMHGLMNYYADDQALRDLSLWSMGSLAGATWSGIILAYVTLAILLLLLNRNANGLNAFLLGEAEARHMGVNVQRFKRNLI